jgi:tetratricopeptide (TPR) repeat protein
MGALIFADQRIFAGGDAIDYVQRTLDNIIEKLSYTLNTNKQLTQENTQLKEKIAELTSLGEKTGEYQERAIQGENKITELTNARGTLEERVKATNELQGKLNSYQVINSQLQETLKEYQAKLIQSDSKVKELEQSLKDKAKEKEKEGLKDYKNSLEQTDEKTNALIRQIEVQKKKMFEAFYSAGKAYTQIKRYKEAIESFQECLEINPDSASVHYNLGILYQYEYGDRMGAISHLKKYLELNPKAKDRKEVEFLLGLLEK